MNITLDQFRELLKTANVNTEMEVCDQELSTNTNQIIYDGDIWNDINLFSEELEIASRIIYHALYKYEEGHIEGIEFTYDNDFDLFDWKFMFPVVVVGKDLGLPYKISYLNELIKEEFPHLLEFSVG